MTSYRAFFILLLLTLSMPASANSTFAQLEAAFDGHLGLYAMNATNNQRIQYQATKPFPIQSTFKVIVVGAILKQSMHHPHLLQQKIHYHQQNLVFWSPITEKHLTDGMTIAELCAAAIQYSDNTATNLLIKKIGGPSSVTAFAHSLGNPTFTVTHSEPHLNSNPHDLADTATPAEMANSLQQLLFGNTLASTQRQYLLDWMKGNTTGDARIRAGVPKGWPVADKTGSSHAYGIANDVGIIWPPQGAPIIVAIYTVQDRQEATPRDDVIATATRLVMTQFGY